MRFLKHPPFKVEATVSVWLAASSSMHPDAKLRITCHIRNRDDLHNATKWAAEGVLHRFGVSEELLKHAEFEYSVDAYIALEPRGVRNPDREPVEAFYFFQEIAPKRKATLVRQRRYVPESQAEMLQLYGAHDPAKVAKVKASQAVPA